MSSVPTQTIEQLLAAISQRERLARKRALLYTFIPILVAGILVLWTGTYLRKAKVEVESSQQKVDELDRKIDSLNSQLTDSADKLVDIATVVTKIESLVESKQSYLRTIDEAQFLIDLRIKFDSLNAEVLKLSESYPAVRGVIRDRKWVTIVKSSKDIELLKQSASAWVSEFGKSNVSIYKTSNGFYALCLVDDGSFTQAYSRTVSLVQSGQAKDAFFAESDEWGRNLLEP